MFIEPDQLDAPTGWIEVICGSMFSGKTEELIRRLRRAQIAGQTTRIFKPAFEQRYAEEAIVTHNQNRIPSEGLTSAEQLLLVAQEVETVGIDEAQFFDHGLVQVVNQLANTGKRVIIAGLDMDFRGRPFGPMPELLAVAEFVTKLHAICMQTGRMAHFSHRIAADAPREGWHLGGADAYEPLSRAAFLRATQTEPESHEPDAGSAADAANEG